MITDPTDDNKIIKLWEPLRVTGTTSKQEHQDDQNHNEIAIRTADIMMMIVAIPLDLKYPSQSAMFESGTAVT